MAGPGGRRRDVAWVAPGDGADYITALPLELRARIASSLPFRQVAQLATLSRPWRHIHRDAPVVNLNLDDFLYSKEGILDEKGIPAAFLNEDALADLEIALARRGQEGSGSKVDTLRINYEIDDPDMRRHGGLIIALADARKICVTFVQQPLCTEELKVDLSAAARDLELHGLYHLAPTVAGPGAAALQTLCLEGVVLREWPSLPSLRSLTLQHACFEAPFPMGARYPRLEHMCIVDSGVVLHTSELHIGLPLLKSLRMDEVYIPPRCCITVDAPELEELNVGCQAGHPYADYHSFTLRAPRLRCLTWRDQFAERVHVDVGKPGAGTSGRIEFTSSRGCQEMNDFRAQMMGMLQGLLPDVPPECLADAARPYITLDKCTITGPKSSGELIPAEKLACDLSALMSSLNV